jgi:folate-binding protein YgfZ
MKELPLAARYRAAGALDMNVHEWRVPRSFGDPVAEYDALRNTAGLLDLTFRVRVRVTGADRVAFLQNMLTNDIAALTAGTGCKAIKLDVRGKVESKVDVLCTPDVLWCDVDPGPASTVLKSLQSRIIMEDVALANASTEHSVLSVQGPHAARVLEGAGIDASMLSHELQHQNVVVEGTEVCVVRRDHTGEDGYDLWIPRGVEPLVWSRLSPRPPGGGDGLTLVGFEAFNMRRVEAGIPWHGTEIQEDRFPQEVGLDEGWISYKKGCYLGQETISRIHHMGHVNRMLCGVRVDGDDVPQPGSAVFHDGKEVGRVTSACVSPRLQRPVALAVLRRESAAVDTRVQMGAAEGPDAQVIALPMA